VATQKVYDQKGNFLTFQSVNGTFTSLSSSLTRISLSEPNTPCVAGYYGTGGTCTQCPPGSTSPPRARTILSCRCDISRGYAGTVICMGCGADTYATAEGCVSCPPGCNSPPFSSSCNCQAALNIETSNNMLSASLRPSYPGFTGQEKNAVFAMLLIFSFTIIFLISFVFVLYQKQRKLLDISQHRHTDKTYDNEEEQQSQRNVYVNNTSNAHVKKRNYSINPPASTSHLFSPSNSFLSQATLNDVVSEDHNSHILTSNLFQNNNNLQV